MKHIKRILRLILCIFLCLPTLAKAEEHTGHTQTILPDSEMPDNEELLQNYIAEQFNSLIPGYVTHSQANPQHLEGNNEKIYQALVPYICDIAAGKRTSTSIPLIPSEIGISGVGTGSTSSEALDNALKNLGLNTADLLRAILFEHPYECYWFDKTKGLSYSYSYSYSSSTTGYTVTITSLEFSFTVASEYASGTYTVNPATGTTVQKAVSNAKDIVDTNASKPEYQRVYAYKDKICDLVSYNYPAANNPATPYGNPWQLVWVFDEDPSTTVVCEGYAKAFQYLCDISEFTTITAYSVTGTMAGGTGEGGHMWNIVNMDDDKNYLVDVTNVDESTIGYPDKLFLKGYSSKSGSYQYNFLIGSTTIRYVYDSSTTNYYTSE